VDLDALADNVALIQWVHLLALVVLMIAGFKMFSTAGRVFKSTMGRTALARAAVRLTGIIPAACGVFFGLLGFVALWQGVELPQPSSDRWVAPYGELEGPLADSHQQHCRMIRLDRLIDALSVSITALLVAYLPGFIAWVVSGVRRKGPRVDDGADELLG
jgi:hypothetical protein